MTERVEIEDDFRRVSGVCPFCHSESWHRTVDMILYRCGTIGCHVTGNHVKGDCLSPSLIQWGPT